MTYREGTDPTNWQEVLRGALGLPADASDSEIAEALLERSGAESSRVSDFDHGQIVAAYARGAARAGASGAFNRLLTHDANAEQAELDRGVALADAMSHPLPIPRGLDELSVGPVYRDLKPALVEACLRLRAHRVASTLLELSDSGREWVKTAERLEAALAYADFLALRGVADSEQVDQLFARERDARDAYFRAIERAGIPLSHRS